MSLNSLVLVDWDAQTPSRVMQNQGGETLDNRYDHLCKILLIGDCGVGKSCILTRFSDGQFYESYMSTIGVDFKIRTIEIDGKIVKLQVWDTGGQERFRAITSSFYRGGNAIIIVYDVSNEVSFLNINRWIEEIERHTSKKIYKILVGNKCDLVDQRKISFDSGKEMADNLKIDFIETSALSSENIEKVFLTVTKQIISNQNKKRQEKQDVNNGSLEASSLKKDKKQKKKCC